MAGRHLNPDQDGAGRSRRQDMDWDDAWQEEEPVRRQRAPRREEYYEEECPARRQQPRQRQEVYYEEERPVRRQRAPRQEEYYYEEERPARRQQPRQRQEQYYYEEERPARRQRAPRQEVYPDGYGRRPAREAYDDRRDRRYDDPEPWRRRGGGGGSRKQSIPLIILVVVLVCGVLFAGGKLLDIMLDYRRDRSAYSDLAEQALGSMTEPDATPDPNAQQGSGDGNTQSASSVDWDYLRSVNPDVVGWLYCPDTMINYPVVQTTDNDFYLHRSFWDRQENVSGTLFADTVCNIGSQYNNYIIYGHNMKDGSMFASLEKYVDANYYYQHPTIYFYTPQGDYRVELIAAHITESLMTNYPYYFESDWDFQNYLNDITSHSYFATNTAVSTQYQLMTLSTCDYSGGYADPRFLVHGLMIPVSGE